MPHPLSFYGVGKLPHPVLEKMLQTYARGGDRVVVGPRVGEDAAVIDFGDRYLVAKTDPITFAADRIGWYAVNVCANDIATMGAMPKWFLATLLLPQGKTHQDMVESIFRDLDTSCREFGISLCGGHTEITYGLDRPIVVGQMLGEVARDALVTSSGARPGDALLLTKGIAVEGTAILAREKRAVYAARLSEETLRRMADFLHHPGISIVPEARALGRVCQPTAMHDPTEGGLATALRELALASGVGLCVDDDAVIVFPETRAACEPFHLDPWGLIASGSLLATVRPDDSAKAIQAVAAAGVSCSLIGTVEEKSFGLKRRRAGVLQDVPAFDADELARVFG